MDLAAACSHNVVLSHSNAMGRGSLSLTNLLTLRIVRLESRAWSRGSSPQARRVAKITISTLTSGNVLFNAEPR